MHADVVPNLRRFGREMNCSQERAVKLANLPSALDRQETAKSGHAVGNVKSQEANLVLPIGCDA